MKSIENADKIVFFQNGVIESELQDLLFLQKSNIMKKDG